ncbi:type 1 glutamine amidotransferase [Frigidibacter sp. ROC022]|uniref:type 1 glutamine amidotransferase n=1 Tax=Frigidibacter sp. ROC022 TaxID=2971796 RepID=UPI00215A5E4D|nr:type 1 glutamine amidotransferase [Frigidibacter sp. ROC022]MCR8723064.1 type 1 glutamine amidotransferase [Frigidibacter sp. ROC022]
MKIGILQCGHFMPEVAERHGDYTALYSRLLAGQGFDFQTWSVVDMEFPLDVHAADGWLLSGSKHGAYEDLPFIKPLEDFIRRAYKARVPMVGICFGHQIMAQALGGKVAKFEGGWAIGRQSYDFDGLGTVALNAWHQDQIIEPPPGARVIARNDFCAYPALAYEGPALSVQPHPEFDNPTLADLVRFRRGAPGYSEEIMDRAEAGTAQPVDNEALARMIGDFFRNSQGADHG